MKTCNVCGLEKPFSEYTKSTQNQGGYTHRCKHCEKAYRQSYKGKLVGLYKTQRCNSKARGHDVPSYSFEAFQSWAESHGYAALHAAWHINGLQRRDAPSADRINDNLPYSLSNLRLTTWGVNDDKGHDDFKSGKLYNKHTAVRQLTKKRELITTYISQSQAQRLTGVPQGNIGMACRNERKTAGGFIWEFIP